MIYEAPSSMIRYDTCADEGTSWLVKRVLTPEAVEWLESNMTHPWQINQRSDITITFIEIEHEDDLILVKMRYG